MNESAQSMNRKRGKGWSQRLASGWMLFWSSVCAGFIACAIIIVALGNSPSAWFLIVTIALSSTIVPCLILGTSQFLDR